MASQVRYSSLRVQGVSKRNPSVCIPYLCRNTATNHQGLIPSVCLSQSSVNGNVDESSNDSSRTSSRSTSSLESKTTPRSRPAVTSRSTTDLESEISTSDSHDVGSELSITSSNQFYDETSEYDYHVKFPSLLLY